ncbi:glyoxalase superfamily protein [Sphingomonas sp. 28-62-11]|uniref:glyoxalase superfamily protein n=1 Tax=Sphingomonas sp. 28-62-11 TaxID=1970432 RepID=UPI000BC3A394|nr:MAG: hypothetical protein B7Y49_02340 [Sphingomonas sp. 28-62-11]
MRDFRDAKQMAQTLREALASKHHRISVGESLELIAHLFGIADWNTLSARIKVDEHALETPSTQRKAATIQFTRTTEEALIRALREAAERGQGEATLDHLLLSLTRDPDAVAMIKACGINLTAFRNLVAGSLEGDVGDKGNHPVHDAIPSPSFQRTVQRAILDLQAGGGESLTGANLLIAILSEEESAAARLLRENGIDRHDD